jgi:hypothetical protein
LHKLWGSFGKLFADRYHARVLRTPREVRNALVYVINNARKHGAWKASHADPYSSGAWFGGWKTSARPAAKCDFVKSAESGPRFLARARSWLLAFGWQRHGWIEPRECPAGA